MNDLLRTEFFSLLTENSQKVIHEEMQNAYRNFVGQVEIIASGNDYTIIYRNLSIIRIELAFLESFHQYGEEKKCA
ncbi:hypothetical protein EZS27_014976 [termite gut metagenome]|jgi:DNA-directed RNA polymerase|uniref:Uncharacterized protein n=1 Tax=termite gut metagenome TaxID=433724 RepID=A0A5J4RUA3_9ZZZZ